MLRFC